MEEREEAMRFSVDGSNVGVIALTITGKQEMALEGVLCGMTWCSESGDDQV